MATIAEPSTRVAIASRQSFATYARRAVVEMLGPRQDKDCSPQPGIDLCEKPGISSQATTWIIVGTVLGVLLVASAAIIGYLTIRRRKQDKQEDMEDRFHPSDYGLDELSSSSRKSRPDDEMKWPQDVSPNGSVRRSRDPLHAGTEPRYQGGQLNGHLNPFDDATSVRSGNGSSYPPSVNSQWPKRESSQQGLPAEGR